MLILLWLVFMVGLLCFFNNVGRVNKIQELHETQMKNTVDEFSRWQKWALGKDEDES